MLKRRDVLTYGATGAAALFAGRAVAQSAPPPPSADVPPRKFDAQSVLDQARTLVKRPYRAPTAELPDAFANMTFDAYVGIRNKPSGVVWLGANVGYAIEPLHRGFAFTAPMQINVVENGAARRLVYDAGAFDFGAVKPPSENKDIGFSGFRVLRVRDGEPPAEVAIFQGASFFRAIAKGQSYGVSARGLSIRTADPKGEETPVFRAVWIERPNLADNALVIHALLDSESVAGAYRFTLRADEAVIIDTEMTLVTRAAIDNLGVAAMAATSIASPLDRRRSDDVRPGVYDVQGLQMLNGRGEWLWRPISNRETLQISAFQDENPHGFGFLQRDRDFSRFLDDEVRWERRPSLWIEPLGDWGPGSVVLIEIPSDSEVNRNIIAYWRPRAPLAANSETTFAYRQFWCWTPPERPPGAIAMHSRSGRPPGAAAGSRRRRFLVEFVGDVFADPQRIQDLAANLAAAPGSIAAAKTYLNVDRKSFRVMFDIDAGSENMSELRLQLEAHGKPISEAWLYRWTP
jgi:periplasmic glucans biosynthesis protein